jgi:hypothetical protein
MEEGTAPGMDSPSVHDLIVAHQEDGRPRFESLRRAFQERQGEIREEYYAFRFPAALLLVAQKRKRRSGGVVYKTRLFYDPARSTQEFDDVFRSARRVERKYAVLLRGRVQEIVTQGLYTTGAHLLAVLDAMPTAADRAKEQTERISAAAASAKKETRQIEDYASIVAMKSALVRYLSGIFLGAVAVALGVYAAVMLPLPDEQRLSVAFCLACGGLGAMVSVMVRITNRRKVRIDMDQGSFVTTLSGTFRSIIGAVFGAIVFVLVTGGLLPIESSHTGEKVLFFAGLAFLAGFSERWAQDTIVRTLPGLPEAADSRPAETGQSKDNGSVKAGPSGSHPSS